MPSLSPLLHAPSLAKHRFIALMAMWAAGSTAWRALMWLQGGSPEPLLKALGIAGFLFAQLLIQDRALPFLKAANCPAWMRFFGVGIVVSGLFQSLQFVVLRFDIAQLHLDSISWRTSLPRVCGWFLAWYGTWWALLRAGWVDVSSCLLAAGLHWTLPILHWDIVHAPQGHAATVISPLGLVFSESESWGQWASSIPLGFFAGWALMFLPGAIAAHECTPRSATVRPLLKQVVGWLAPAIVALTLTAAITLLFIAAGLLD